MNSPEKYPEKLFNELGIKTVQRTKSQYREGRNPEHVFEIVSSDLGLIYTLLNKCYLADCDENTPRVIIGKLLLAAQRVVDADLKNLSDEIKNLHEAIKQFDEREWIEESNIISKEQLDSLK